MKKKEYVVAVYFDKKSEAQKFHIRTILFDNKAHFSWIAPVHRYDWLDGAVDTLRCWWAYIVRPRGKQ